MERKLKPTRIKKVFEIGTHIKLTENLDLNFKKCK
jgi:hypothetical protein